MQLLYEVACTYLQLDIKGLLDFFNSEIGTVKKRSLTVFTLRKVCSCPHTLRQSEGLVELLVGTNIGKSGLNGSSFQQPWNP